MRVGILGGAFNPPHKGHKELTKIALKETNLDKIWVMPCFNHNSNKIIEPAEHRLNMCKLMWRDMPEVEICPYEIQEKSSGKMFDTITDLKGIYNHDFYLIIAMDNAESMYKWYKGDELVKKFPFIVSQRVGEKPRASCYSRFGEKPKLGWYRKKPHLLLGDTPMEGSSTEYRYYIKAWWDTMNKEQYLHQKLGGAVFTYIKQNYLYIG